ncbi:MAG: hypothetical protein CL961_01170 [Euryarchaeota archaeon]|nr:hypothetical protein [Euryarchaeota archaeon]
MKQNENTNRDATLKGDEIRSGFVTINNLRMRARLARNGTSGGATGNCDNSFTPPGGGWGDSNSTPAS